MKSATSERCKQQRVFYVVAAAIERFTGPPVLHNLMIVPLGKNGHLGVELPQIRVEQVVFVVATIAGESRRDRALFLGHNIAPRLAVRQLLLRGYCAVCIDAVAAMNEEVGTIS